MKEATDRGRWKRAMLAADFLDLLEAGGKLEIVIRNEHPKASEGYGPSSLCGIIEPGNEREAGALTHVCRDIALRLIREAITASMVLERDP